MRPRFSVHAMERARDRFDSTAERLWDSDKRALTEVELRHMLEGLNHESRIRTIDEIRNGECYYKIQKDGAVFCVRNSTVITIMYVRPELDEFDIPDPSSDDLVKWRGRDDVILDQIYSKALHAVNSKQRKRK